jgi:hypothetical protein
MSTTANDSAPGSEEIADRIVLELPGDPRLRGVVTLVLGGIGSRLDLPYEKVDDLQLAVLSVLSASDLETVTLDVQVEEDVLRVGVGPLPGGISDDQGLRRVLERLVDAIESTASSDGRPEAHDGEPAVGDWITLALVRAPSGAARD